MHGTAVVPLYPITSTLPPCFAILIAWYCIRGLRPISPRTSTWTEILGSLIEPDDVALGGECLIYRVGQMRSKKVKVVEAITASVKRSSSIVTWLQHFVYTTGPD
jgi:hypothetical protein